MRGKGEVRWSLWRGYRDEGMRGEVSGKKGSPDVCHSNAPAEVTKHLQVEA